MDTATSNLQALAARVEKLERQNRVLKRGGVAVLLLALCVAVMGQARSRTVEAERITLKDAQGRNRLVIGTGGKFDDRAFLMLYDSRGFANATVTEGFIRLDEISARCLGATGQCQNAHPAMLRDFKLREG